MTLAALRARIGRADFARVLRRWTADHRLGHGTTGQFEALAAQVSGQDLGSFFDAWLHEGNRPEPTATNGL
jgi:aminopeptidase N